jgi:hypothetical protein
LRFHHIQVDAVQSNLEFGNYLLSINNDETKKIFIEGSILNHPNKSSLLNMFRVEDESENKIVVENEIEVKYYSQVNEFIDVFGLLDNSVQFNLSLLIQSNNL